MRRFGIMVALLFGSLVVVGSSSAQTARAGDRKKDSAVVHLQQNANVSMTASAPMTTLAKAERAIRNAGGQVNSSNGNDNNASVNGRVPRGRLDDVLAAVRGLPGRVTGVNRHASDITSSVRQYERRLDNLKLAESALARAMEGATDDERRGLVVVFELAERERTSVHSTLDSYASQTKTAGISISITRAKK